MNNNSMGAFAIPWGVSAGVLGAPKVIPTPDFMNSQGERKHRKTPPNKEQPGGGDLGVGISVWLLGFLHDRNSLRIALASLSLIEVRM